MDDLQSEEQLLLSVSSDSTTYYSTVPSHDVVGAAVEDGDDDNNLVDTPNGEQQHTSVWNIICILSTAFSYGCIISTLFLITLPSECERIHDAHAGLPKSVALGVFVSIAGATQLISPLVGRLSDIYIPPVPYEIGQRMPYLMLGAVLTVTGLLGQMLASEDALWFQYSFCFFLDMIGLNIIYAMMLALLPDQIPYHQTGMANGILALLLVLGSLLGFGFFFLLGQNVHNMYGLYTCIVIVSTILTGTHAHDRDAEITATKLLERRQQQLLHANGASGSSHPEPPLPAGREQDSNLALLRSPAAPQWQKMAKKAVRKAKDIVLTPAMILKSMTDPLYTLSWTMIWKSYSIDTKTHYDFLVVTVSRLFYYCGMSVQTFFLYFVHDIIRVQDSPENVVATLAILGQCSGAITCYPVGIWSDRILGGQRKPFVYLACAILACTTLSIIMVRTLHQMMIASIVLGAANGIYLTMDTSLAVDTLAQSSNDRGRPVGSVEDGVALEKNKSHPNISAPDVSEKDATSGSGQLLGVWGVCAFLGSALGPMIGGPLLYAFGHKMEVDPHSTTEEYTIQGYAVILSLSSFYFLCSALSLTFLRDRRR